MFLDHLVKRLSNTCITHFNAHSNSASFFHTSPQSASSSKSRSVGAASNYARRMLKEYELPEIKSEDCEQTYISGWGPGGQKVNTAQNAAQLRHKPTNIVIKVHESRLLQDNIKIAFDRLRIAVDRHFNGDKCYESRFQLLEQKYEQKMKRSREKRRQNKQSSEDNLPSTDS